MLLGVDALLQSLKNCSRISGDQSGQVEPESAKDVAAHHVFDFLQRTIGSVDQLEPVANSGETGVIAAAVGGVVELVLSMDDMLLILTGLP